MTDTFKTRLRNETLIGPIISLPCADVADLSCSMLVLSVRNYLLPGSQRGPAANLTLAPRLIPLTVP